MDYGYYHKIEEYFRAHPGTIPLVRWSNRIFTCSGFIMYPLLIACLVCRHESWRMTGGYILLPGLAFLLLSVYRHKKNAKRPYELYDIDPVIKKDSTGNSFPSRHVFSSFLISILWMKVCLPAGIILFIISCLLGLVRVIGGVHFVRDVAAGAVIGILSGIITVLLV